ncbi:hypothetical protein [Weissella paramesenteroides]|uniref:hypothetical protein n=1 Tax=Weissella paramesenteroides TaxID=1249 RepID=UPI0018DA3B88|nr:hypothetical protein [Weissella paramesenteroides]QPI45381.1 hypothetical protein I2E55_00105 [Weissella paramesenteroides]QPI45391.1 hypothetical protein I2E55_00040 [Weissella paramesenteroides]
MQNSKKKVVNWVKEQAQINGNILNRSDLLKILDNYQQTSFKNAQRMTLHKLKKMLVFDLQLFDELRIVHKEKVKTRLVPNYIEVDPIEIGLSLAGKKAYVSHLSALYVQGLTNLSPKDIYINEEQTPKTINKENALLTQTKVDKAFARPIRTTSNLATFTYKNIRYSVTILNGKNTGYVGVTNKEHLGFSKRIRVSSVERALIESTVRPGYAGGVKEVLWAYERAYSDEQVSVNKLCRLLNVYNYIYPYKQAIYFYMQYSGFDQDSLEKVKPSNGEAKIKFYLDHQLINPKLDERSMVYYPKELLE